MNENIVCGVAMPPTQEVERIYYILEMAIVCMKGAVQQYWVRGGG